MSDIRNGNTQIEFGYGTIKITSGLVDGYGILGLNEHKSMPVGFNAGTTETPESLLDSKVMMRFRSVKSLEVLILKLQEVRGMMIGVELEEIEAYKKDLNDITEAYQPNNLSDILY